MSPEELKAEWLSQAEEMINQIIGNKSPVDEISLNEIEETAIEAGKRFGEMVLRGMVEEVSQEGVGNEPICPQCQGRLQRQGKRPRAVVSVAGEVTMERDYYYCPTCKQGFFPPG